MSNQSLVVLGQQDIVKGGIGTGSKLFKVQPATIQLVQKMSRAEGAIPGKLRIKETGQHYDRMQLVILFEPVERRSYFEGDDFSPENQLCFSLDNITPHEKAKIPQAMNCSSCSKSSWEKYRQTSNKADIPKCKNYWHNMVIDRVTKLPYYLDIKSTSIKPYTRAMQEIARQVALLQSQGKSPNIFDFSFELFAESQKNGQYYTYGFKNVAPINDADRQAFGEIFLSFINRNRKTDEELLNETAVEEGEYVNNELTEAPAPAAAEPEEVITI